MSETFKTMVELPRFLNVKLSGCYGPKGDGEEKGPQLNQDVDLKAFPSEIIAQACLFGFSRRFTNCQTSQFQKDVEYSAERRLELCREALSRTVAQFTKGDWALREAGESDPVESLCRQAAIKKLAKDGVDPKSLKGAWRGWYKAANESRLTGEGKSVEEIDKIAEAWNAKIIAVVEALLD